VDLVVSFLTKYSQKFEFPDSMADINVTSDYKKIANILRLLPKEDSDEIISTVLDSEKISELLSIQFNFELPFTRVEAISVLYYNGLLTIENAELGLYNFVIPNYVVKQMYWEYFESIEKVRSIAVDEIGVSFRDKTYFLWNFLRSQSVTLERS